MPLLGLLATPITLTRGPVASYNFLLWLGLTASATACFLVLRRWVQWRPAAYIGGLLYAFSAYMTGQAAIHLNLIFLPIPPIMLFVLGEILVDQRKDARRWGIGLGLLAAGQFLISPEVLIDCVIVALLGVVLLAVTNRRAVAQRLRHAARGLSWAVLAMLPFLLFPLWVFFAGPQRYAGTPQLGKTYPEDLLSTIFPTFNQWISPSGVASFGTRLNVSRYENGAYLGLLLLGVLTFLVVRYRRVGVIRFFAAMAAVVWILSLGPRLIVDNHATIIRLPFAVILHLPVVDGILAGRFAFFLDLFCGFIVAIGMDRLRRDLMRRDHRSSNTTIGASVLLLSAVAIVLIIPAWPYATSDVRSTTPGFFRSGDVMHIPPESVALTYPYPNYPENQAMLWQAESSMQFRIVGGYALIPGDHGQADYGPAQVRPASVPRTLINFYQGGSSATPPATATDIRAFIHRYGIESVMVDPSVGAHPGAAAALFTTALGPPTFDGGILLWSDLRCPSPPTTCTR